MNALVKAPLDGEIIAPDDRVFVCGRLCNPLIEQPVQIRVAAGLSIAELLIAAGVGRRDYEGSSYLVYVNYLPVPEFAGDVAWWPRVRPKAGSVINFVPKLGNLKSGLMLALAVAAAVAAFVIAGPAGLALTGTAFTIGTAVISTGIIFAGSMALNAIFPTRPPQLASSEQFKQLPSIAGARNTAPSFDDAIPQNLGTNRFSPYFAPNALPYTELVGDDQYLICLFIWGHGPQYINPALLKIGETPLSSFEYSMETKQGLPADPAITIYPSEPTEEALNIELTAAGGTGTPLDDDHINWQVRTSQVNADVLSVDVTAPQGVYKVDGDGNPGGYTVSVKAQYRAVGSSGAWSSLGAVIFYRSLKTARLGMRQQIPRGQYDVRVGKAQTTFDDQLVKEQVIWTALRSFTNEDPLRNLTTPMAATALRIRATGQTSGVIDTFNGILSSLVLGYSGSGDVWNTLTQSSNPADLIRWVLQSSANARPVPDALIDLDNLQAFWIYCRDNGFRYDDVRANRSSIYSACADIASAGRGKIVFNDGKWAVAWDRPEDPIVQHFTPRNSWDFSGQRAYPTMPHGWRVKFINAENGYAQDERIVYDDGYDESNASIFEAMEFPGVKYPDMIWRHGRFHIAQVRLRPEEISLSTGWENLVCTNGDRVSVTHDVLLIGQIAGRVKLVSGQNIKVDEAILIEDGKTYAFRFRLADADNTSIIRSVDGLAAGEYAPGELIPLTGDLTVLSQGDLFGFGETDRESAVYRIKGIAHRKDLTAQLVLVDDAPEISLADVGDIPEYDPHITIPTDPYTLPPQHLTATEIIDGYGVAVRSLVRLAWTRPRLGNVGGFEVEFRDDDSGGDWKPVATVLPPTTQIDIPITSAGAWSFRVRCLFTDGTWSTWASQLGLHLLALSFAPGDVTNLHQHSIEGRTVLDWTVVVDQRVLRYEIRKGSSWETGLLVGDEVGQPPWNTTGDGTYFVRAYILSAFNVRIYSDNAASITIAGSIITRNIILEQDEQALGWTGGLAGGVIDGSFIRTDIAAAALPVWAQEVVDDLELDGLHIAVYLSTRHVDIGRAAECRFWTEYEGVGVLQGEDFLATTISMPGTDDILGAASTRFIRAFPIWRFATEGASDVFMPTDVFDPTDVFQAGITWNAWVAIASGTRVSRFYQAGYVVITDKETVDATGTKFRWFVDVPDRSDDYTALAVPDTGLDISFYPNGYNGTPTPGVDATPFNGGPNDAPLPHVQRAIVDATNGDEVKITNLTLSGCTIHVVNAGSNVTRSGVNLLVRGF
jgi:hypothetical protein